MSSLVKSFNHLPKTAADIRAILEYNKVKDFEQLIHVIIANIEYSDGVLEVSGSLSSGTECYTFKDVSSPKVLGVLESLGYTVTMIPNGLFSKVIFSALKETDNV